MRSLLFILFLIAATSVQAQTKVGYTNVELIMFYMPEVTAANASLEVFQKEKLKEISDKKVRITELIKEYQEKVELDSFSSSEEESNLVDAINALEREINEKETYYEYEVNQKRNQLLQPVMNKLQEAIDAVAEENGYTYILNQTSGTNILYGVEQFEVTDLIAAKLGISIPK